MRDFVEMGLWPRSMSTMNEAEISMMQAERATAWLAEKWTGGKNCPICQTENWTVTGAMVMQSYGVGDKGQSRDVFPVFHAVCTSCGFLRTFNAVIAGLTDPFVNIESGEVSGG